MTIADKPWSTSMVEAESTLSNPKYAEEYSAVCLDFPGDSPSVCYYFAADVLGTGDKELGQDLLGQFFTAMEAKELHPNYLVFVNTGVFLTAASSPVLQQLQGLEKRGTTILISRDSAVFYELSSQIEVGTFSSMEEILLVFHGVDKVITL